MKKFIFMLVIGLAILPSLSFAEVIGDIDPNIVSSCVSISDNLSYRSRDITTNGAVSTFQDFLQSEGYLNFEPTGYFGLLTLTATKAFQSANGILNSGYVGPITRAKISSLTCGTSVIPPVINPPQPIVISEQVKCVFNGDTTVQKCSGVGSFTTTDGGMEIYPPQFYCSGVGSCVTKVSGPKGMKLTWNSSCTGDKKLPFTTIDGNDEYANFNCGTSSNLPPVINGLDAPTTLLVGQVGTWTVKAYDPENGQLSYSVTWGDEYRVTIGQSSISNSSVQQFTQSTSFNHSYSSSGVYTVNVTVKDSAGLTSQTSVTVNVGNVGSINNSPNIIGLPAIPTDIQPGQIVNISLSAKDLDNDDLSWSVDWGENIGETISCSLIRRQTGTGWSFSKDHSWQKAGVYKVKVTVSDCVGGSDSYSFTVNVGNVTTPSITVVSPNGGESWQKGTTQTIKWQDNRPIPTCTTNNSGGVSSTCIGYTKYYDIYLSPVCTGNICPTLYIEPTIIAKKISGSSYSWTVTPLLNQSSLFGGYMIKVCDYGNGINVCDSSDSYFKIFSSSSSNHAPEILTSSSNIGTIKPGQTVNFGWTAMDKDNDDLSWSINWGDGQGQDSVSTVCAQSGKGWAFNASHSWAQVGTYKVNVTVSDCEKAIATSVQYITVENKYQPQQTTTKVR